MGTGSIEDVCYKRPWYNLSTNRHDDSTTAKKGGVRIWFMPLAQWLSTRASLSRSQHTAIMHVQSSAVLSTPPVPIDVVEEIFRHLWPYTRNVPPREVQTALARCARVCHAFHRPGAAVLWRKQRLINACRVLPTLTLAPIRGSASDGGEGTWRFLEVSAARIEGNI